MYRANVLIKVNYINLSLSVKFIAPFEFISKICFYRRDFERNAIVRIRTQGKKYCIQTQQVCDVCASIERISALHEKNAQQIRTYYLILVCKQYL